MIILLIQLPCTLTSTLTSYHHTIQPSHITTIPHYKHPINLRQPLLSSCPPFQQMFSPKQKFHDVNTTWFVDDCINRVPLDCRLFIDHAMSDIVIILSEYYIES